MLCFVYNSLFGFMQDFNLHTFYKEFGTNLKIVVSRTVFEKLDECMDRTWEGDTSVSYLHLGRNRPNLRLPVLIMSAPSGTQVCDCLGERLKSADNHKSVNVKLIRS